MEIQQLDVWRVLEKTAGLEHVRFWKRLQTGGMMTPDYFAAHVMPHAENVQDNLKGFVRSYFEFDMTRREAVSLWMGLAKKERDMIPHYLSRTANKYLDESFIPHLYEELDEMQTVPHMIELLLESPEASADDYMSCLFKAGVIRYEYLERGVFECTRYMSKHRVSTLDISGDVPYVTMNIYKKDIWHLRVLFEVSGDETLEHFSSENLSDIFALLHARSAALSMDMLNSPGTFKYEKILRDRPNRQGYMISSLTCSIPPKKDAPHCYVLYGMSSGILKLGRALDFSSRKSGYLSERAGDGHSCFTQGEDVRMIYWCASFDDARHYEMEARLKRLFDDSDVIVKCTSGREWYRTLEQFSGEDFMAYVGAGMQKAYHELAQGVH